MFVTLRNILLLMLLMLSDGYAACADHTSGSACHNDPSCVWVGGRGGYCETAITPQPAVLRADYHLDECDVNNNSQNVADSSPNNYHATVFRDLTSAENGQICKAYNFNGSQLPDYISVPSAVLNGKTNYSFSMWIKPSSLNIGDTFISAERNNNDNDELLIRIDNYGHVMFTQQGYANLVAFNATTASFTLNAWNYLAVTKFGKEICLYLNNNAKECQTASSNNYLNPLSILDGAFMIAQDSAGADLYYAGGNFEGEMDEVLIFEETLTESEVQQIRNNQTNHRDWNNGTSARVCPSCIVTPVADWHFDECSWDGTINEVQDSSINSYHGVSHNGLTTEDEAQIERAGLFDGVDDYIEQNNIYDLLKATASLSFWIKTTQPGNDLPWLAPGVTGVEQNGGTDDIFWGWLDASGHIGITAKSDSTSVKSSNPVNDDNWHHIVLTRDNVSGLIQIYVDGTLEDSDTHPAGIIGNSFNRLGSINDTGGSPTYFQGHLDELKIYDGVLTNTQVADIYNNESIGKNYDGTDRTPISCAIGPSAEYRMDACTLSDVNWTLDSSGNNYTASYTGDKLSMQEGKLCSGVEILQDSLINEVNAFKAGIDTTSLGDVGTIAFWYRSNQQWNQSPGKMLVDSTKGDKYFFLGLQSDGQLQYYVEDNADGDFQSWTNTVFSFAADEWVHLAFSWDIPAKSFNVFVNGVQESLYIANNSAGGSGRTIPSGLNELFIGDISFNYTQNPSVYDGLRNSADGRFDEVKLFNTALEQSDVAQIYSRENSGRNYNDNKLRVCSPCNYEPLDPAAHFDVWDTFRDINDRNISTKLSAQNFDITLAALNKSNDNYQEFNGTVCTQVVDYEHANAAKSSWVKSLFSDANTTTITFNVPSAVKNSRVNIVWKRNVDEACPLSNEDNTTLSSDNFAVRPNRFSLTLSGPYYAGELFTLIANANNVLSMATHDYNETQAGGSFAIDANETRPACNTGTETFTIGNADFTHGVTPSIDANFTGIATYLNLEIHENNGSEFAVVDSDDTNDMQRLIAPHDVNITVNPYELNVTLTEINASTDTNWIYMADVADMNISLHVTMQANNKQHNILKDFNSSCYAQDINIKLGVMTDGDAALDMNYSAVMGTFSDGTTLKNEQLQEINQTMTIPANNFILGIGESRMDFNVDRKHYDPIKPFKISGLSATITSASTAKEHHDDTTLNDANISLYYGRLKTTDIKTSQDNASGSIEIEVYDGENGSSYTAGFKQNSLHWWRHENHTLDSYGDAVDINATTTTTNSRPLDFSIPAANIGNPSNGTIGFSVPKHIGRYILHVKTQPWLWYIPKEFGSSYNDAINSKCSEHPCLIYTFEDESTSKNISTGTFKGGDSKVYDRGVHTKKGVKVFR